MCEKIKIKCIINNINFDVYLSFIIILFYIILYYFTIIIYTWKVVIL